MAQPLPNPPLSVETADDKAERLSWERARLAEADTSFAAGLYIEGEEANAWLEQELAEAKAAFDHESD